MGKGEKGYLPKHSFESNEIGANWNLFWEFEHRVNPQVCPLEDFRVVYGGGHTILIDKITRKRVCMVTKDEHDSSSLVRAVLYLVLKFKGLGGSQIEEWTSKFMPYANLKMQISFEGEFLKWLLEYGSKESYSYEESTDILNRIYYKQNNGDRFNSFLYFLCEDRFGIKAEEIAELISSAVCSEKEEKTTFERLKSKEINTLSLEVNEIVGETCQNDLGYFQNEVIQCLNDISKRLEELGAK